MTLTELKCNQLNQLYGSLREVDCTICRNKGYVAEVEGDSIRTYECECMAKRRSLARIRKSGLADLLEICTFKNFHTVERWQKDAKQKAMEYVQNGDGKWFVISGTPGSGKTHLCTAICGEMIRAGREVRYMLWRSEAPRLKALVNERDEYERVMEEFCDMPVLYIDDFFKGNVTEADINLAFELLNNRYNSKKKMTLISGERSIEEILYIDEAIGSRIYERSKGFCVLTPAQNWRLK